MNKTSYGNSRFSPFHQIEKTDIGFQDSTSLGLEFVVFYNAKLKVLSPFPRLQIRCSSAR